MSASNTKNADPTAWMDEPVEAKGWINLYFFRDGKSYRGVQLHSSEEVALQKSFEFLSMAEDKMISKGAADTHFTKMDNQLLSNFSHTMQIPVIS